MTYIFPKKFAFSHSITNVFKYNIKIDNYFNTSPNTDPNTDLNTNPNTDPNTYKTFQLSLYILYTVIV